MDTEFLKPGVEHRMRPGDADIGGQCQVHARAHRGTVDRRDGRQSAASHRHEPGVDPLQSVTCRGPQGRKVGSRAERLTGTGHHDGVNAGVGLGPLHGIAQLLGHGVGDGVAALRIVDGDHRDAIDNFEKNQISHGHRG